MPFFINQFVKYRGQAEQWCLISGTPKMDGEEYWQLAYKCEFDASRGMVILSRERWIPCEDYEETIPPFIPEVTRYK